MMRPSFAPFFICLAYFVVLGTCDVGGRWRGPERGTHPFQGHHHHQGGPFPPPEDPSPSPFPVPESEGSFSSEGPLSLPEDGGPFPSEGPVPLPEDGGSFPSEGPLPLPEDGLQMNFYYDSCRSVEEIVRSITWARVAANPTLAAKLLRLHYHDCFVRGCDASILLKSTATSKAEKDALPNLSLGGYDVIDEVKAQLEEKCPGIVSCADIVALVARDAVSYQFKRNLWEVFTGRRDGSISLASEVSGNLPSPFSNFSTLQQNFAKKRLNVVDLVVLAGAHTIGVGHCILVKNRLYNFTGKGDADPSLNTAYVDFLRKKCGNPFNNSITLEMDPNSALSFDSHYYYTLDQDEGLFQSDAALLTDTDSARMVQDLQKPFQFFTRFRDSIQKMGSVEVLTGNNGNIRKQCSVLNP